MTNTKEFNVNLKKYTKDYKTAQKWAEDMQSGIRWSKSHNAYSIDYFLSRYEYNINFDTVAELTEWLHLRMFEIGDDSLFDDFINGLYDCGGISVDYVDYTRFDIYELLIND